MPECIALCVTTVQLHPVLLKLMGEPPAACHKSDNALSMRWICTGKRRLYLERSIHNMLQEHAREAILTEMLFSRQQQGHVIDTV